MIIGISVDTLALQQKFNDKENLNFPLLADDAQKFAKTYGVFTGKVREAVEQGSLQLYVGLQVRKPGRYVMQGRVDDEAGVPFAFVSFNEELQAGAREVRFTVFGLLIREAAPDFPLKLRDVDGFLLREDAAPDRELVKPLSGYVYTTREYTGDSFSPDEWTSEERQRYLDEYSKDAREAQEQVDKLKGPPEKAPAP